MSSRRRTPSHVISPPRHTRPPRAAARSAPTPVTLSMRPPFVTRRPSCSAVPAWKTSAPARLGRLDPADRRAAVAVRGIVAGGEHDRDGRASAAARADAAEIAGGGGGEHREQVAVEQRQQRLRLGIAEAAVVLEHARAVGGQHEPREERPDEGAAARRELGQHRAAGEVDELARPRRRRGRGPGRTSPCRRCSGPRSPSNARLKSCAGGSASAATPSQSAKTDTSGPSSSSSTTSGPPRPSSSASAGRDLVLRRADDDALSGRKAVRLEHARRDRLGEPRGRRHVRGGHDVLREALRPLDRGGRRATARTPGSRPSAARPPDPPRAAPRARRRRDRPERASEPEQPPRHPRRARDGNGRARRCRDSRERRGARSGAATRRASMPARARAHPSRRRGLRTASLRAPPPRSLAVAARGRPRGPARCRRARRGRRAPPRRSGRTPLPAPGSSLPSSSCSQPGSVSHTGRQWWKSDWCAGKSSVSLPSGQRVADADRDLGERREDIELGQRERRDAVDAHCEAEGRRGRASHSGARGPSRCRTHRRARAPRSCASPSISDGNGPFADAGHVRLRDAEDLVDPVRADAEARRPRLRRSGSTT